MTDLSNLQLGGMVEYRYEGWGPARVAALGHGGKTATLAITVGGQARNAQVPLGSSSIRLSALDRRKCWEGSRILYFRSDGGIIQGAIARLWSDGSEDLWIHGGSSTHLRESVRYGRRRGCYILAEEQRGLALPYLRRSRTWFATPESEGRTTRSRSAS